MNWIDKLERKYGRFGVQNLTMYVIICYVVGYVLAYYSSQPAEYAEPGAGIDLAMDRYWRIITWVIYPPSTTSCSLVCDWQLSFFTIRSEHRWNVPGESFRYTLYIFSGILFSVIGAFILYFITGAYGIRIFV